MKGISPDFLGGHYNNPTDLTSYMTAGILYVYDVSIQNDCGKNVSTHLRNTEKY